MAGHDDGTAPPPPRQRHRPPTLRSALPHRAAKNDEHRFLGFHRLHRFTAEEQLLFLWNRGNLRNLCSPS